MPFDQLTRHRPMGPILGPAMRHYETPGGGYASELSITVDDERINQGRWSNIPLLVPHQSDVEGLLAGGRPTGAQQEQAIRAAFQRLLLDREAIPYWDTLQDAEGAATARSEMKGAMR